MTEKKPTAKVLRGALKERHKWVDHTACCGVWRPANWGCVPKVQTPDTGSG